MLIGIDVAKSELVIARDQLESAGQRRMTTAGFAPWSIGCEGKQWNSLF